MKSRENALQIAGEVIAEGSLALKTDVDLGVRIGRAQAFHLVHAVSEVGKAKEIKRLKESGEYKRTGLTWEKFCPVYLGLAHVTANNAIANLSALGEAYFTVNQFVPVSPTTFGLIAGTVNEKGIEIDGETISFTTANAPRIKSYIEGVRRNAQTAKREAETAKSEATTANTERDNARKAAADTRRKLNEALNPKLFADADPDHQALLRVQSNWDRNLALLTEIQQRQLSIENEARYIGLMEHIYRSLVQITDAARYDFGRGSNTSDPSDALFLNNTPDNSRDLIAEFTAATKEAKK